MKSQPDMKWYVVVGGAWLGLAVTVLLLNLGATPFFFNEQSRAAAATVAPQGWGFFTKSPREESYRAFERSGRAWREVDYHNASTQNALGLSRNLRVVALEIGRLNSQLPQTAWRECRGVGACLKSVGDEPAIAVEGPSSASPRLCGDIVLLRQAPVPWLWAQRQRTVEAPARVLRVNVECSGGAA